MVTRYQAGMKHTFNRNPVTQLTFIDSSSIEYIRK
jgi:hypothetical protein